MSVLHFSLLLLFFHQMLFWWIFSPVLYWLYRNELVCDTNYGKSGNRKLSYINIHEFYKVKQSSGMNGECLYIFFSCMWNGISYIITSLQEYNRKCKFCYKELWILKVNSTSYGKLYRFNHFYSEWIFITNLEVKSGCCSRLKK